MYRVNIHSPRAKKNLSGEIEDLKPPSTIKEEENLNFLKTLYFVMGVISIFLALFSHYTWTHTTSYSILILFLASILSKISAILGVVGCFREIKDLKYKDLIASGEKESLGKKYLMISFYLMLVCIIFLLVFGTHALFYSERSQAYLEAYYYSDPAGFEAYYGNSLENIEKWGILLITISGYTAYIIIIVMLFITYFAYVLSALYNSIETMFEILNLNIMNLGLAMVYITVYCIEYNTQIKFQANTPKNIQYAVIVVGCMLCAVCILGFWVLGNQSNKTLKAYLVVNFFMIVACALCSTVSVRSSSLFKEGLSEKCFDFMAIVSAEYISELGCAKKYLNTTSVQENQCAKGQNRYIWENTEEIEENYGCLNSYCCDVLIADAKTKLDYLGICSAGCIFLIGMSLWACYYLFKKINASDSAHRHNPNLKIWVWGVLSPCITIVGILYFIPQAPYLPPYIDADVVVGSATLVDSRLLSDSWCYTDVRLDLHDSGCDQCSKSEYFADVLGTNGCSDLDLVSSYSLPDLLAQVSRLKLCPVCSGSPYQWIITVYRRDYWSNSTTETVINASTYPPEETFYNTTLRGFTTPVSDITSVSACYPYAFDASPYTIEGLMSPYRLPHTLALLYTSPGYMSTTRLINVGGLPLYPYTIGPTQLVSDNGTINITFRAVSLHGDPIKSFSLEFRTGYNNYTGPCDAVAFEGTEKIYLLPNNIYSVVANSPGFKSDYTEIANKSLLVLLFTPDNFEENEARIVLGWKTDSDLDLTLDFILNQDYECEVSYTNKICGGASLAATSSSGLTGGEEIAIENIGAYQYLLYLKEFKAGKDEFIDCLADLKVYVKSYKHPVVRIQQQNQYTWNVESDQYKVWLGFCINGIQGIVSIAPLQTFVSVDYVTNSLDICSQIYGNPYIYKPGEKLKIQAESPVRIPKNIISTR